MAEMLGDRSAGERQGIAARAKGGLLVLGGFVVVLFVIEVINFLLTRSLNRTFGLRPRSADGLLDILTFPLLHANLNHLLSNALPLIIFGFLVFLSGIRVFLTALGFSWLGSGVTVWLIGDRGVTVGASGPGFWFVCVPPGAGILQPSWKQILLAVVLFMLLRQHPLRAPAHRGRVRLLAGAPGRCRGRCRRSPAAAATEPDGNPGAREPVRHLTCSTPVTGLKAKRRRSLRGPAALCVLRVRRSTAWRK